MKTIFVYGNNSNEILDKIFMEKVPETIVYKNCEYFVWNTDVGFLKHPPQGRQIDEYNGTFFFYYDQ